MPRWVSLGQKPLQSRHHPELVVVPLFILMGNVATATGMSRQLFDAAYAIIGHIRGGLASATVVGCGGFAALSGSSVASALTMGKVSLAEMERFKYDPRLSTGVVAAGGTLGILIPPSTGFVIFRNLDRTIHRAAVPCRRYSRAFAVGNVHAHGVDHLLHPPFGWPTRTRHHMGRKAPRDQRCFSQSLALS